MWAVISHLQRAQRGGHARLRGRLRPSEAAHVGVAKREQLEQRRLER
jgi:hypothetical protein